MLDEYNPNVFALPSSTPAVVPYPNLVDSTQHARNNFKPTKRQFKRVPSAQENEWALKKILKEYWRYDNFREGQLEICMEVIKGNDVFVNAPTGLGKSVCFQVPAVTLVHGITIVITPLIALMIDQVSNLRERGIEAAMLSSTTTPDEARDIKRQLCMGHPRLRLLYVTPETLFGSKYSGFFKRCYEQKQLMRLVIDEAHVIDDWGWDFRAEYGQLGRFREAYPNVPITALTASATSETRRHICKTLRIRSGHFAQFVFAVNRKNLFYEIKMRGPEDDKEKAIDVVKTIKECKRETQARGRPVGCGLVYCRTKPACDSLSKYLNRSGIRSTVYHAGLSEADKHIATVAFQEGQVECIVATIAFGMGIDKPDVRFVIHFDVPHGFEAYYQETGRAGRDGHMSRCVLYYSREDARDRRSMVEKTARRVTTRAEATDKAEAAEDFKRRHINSFKSLQAYAEDIKTCRHVTIARYFEEDNIDVADQAHLEAYCNKMCDVCVNKGAVFRRACLVSEEVPIASQVLPAPQRPSSPLEPSSQAAIANSLIYLQDIRLFHRSSSNDTRGGLAAEPMNHDQALLSSASTVPSHLPSSPLLPDPHSRTSPPHASSLVVSLPRSPLIAQPSNRREPSISSDQSAGPSHAPGPSRQEKNAEAGPSRFDIAAGEGFYATADRLPTDHRKRKAQEDKFLATEPASTKGKGPYEYYTPNTPLPRPKTQVRSQGFKTPFIKSTDKLNSGTITSEKRAKGVKDILEGLRTALCAGDLADQAWEYFGRGEQENRKRTVKRVAQEYEAEMVQKCYTPADYDAQVEITLRGLRIPTSAKGVELLITGQLAASHGARVEVEALLAIGERLRRFAL